MLSQCVTVLELLTHRNEGYDCKKVTSVKINQILPLVAVKFPNFKLIAKLQQT